METEYLSGKLSIDLKSNIKELKSIISKYLKMNNNKEKEELLINASFLIEKIIFYTQLEEGVEKVATYTYNEKDIAEITNPYSLLKFDEEEYDIRDLFLLRGYIVAEYKKMKLHNVHSHKHIK